MGINQKHLLGRGQKLYAVLETTEGTYEPIDTNDSMQILKCSMGIKPTRNNIVTSYMSHREIMERRSGRTDLTWAIDANYMPSGTKDVAPACFKFLHALLGDETVGANDVTIVPSESQSLQSLTLVHQVDQLQTAMWGCIPDEFSFKFAGGEEPTIHIAGEAMGWAQTGPGVLSKKMNGAITKSETADAGAAVLFTSEAHGLLTGYTVTVAGTTDYNGTYTVTVMSADTFKVTKAFVDNQTGTWKTKNMTLTAAGTNQMMVNSLIQVGTDNNSSAGFLVENIDDAPVFTLDAVASGDAAAAVIPFVPTWAPVGSVMSGLVGTMTFDTLSLVGPMTGFDLSIKSGNKLIKDGAFEQYMSDAIAGIFEITGTIAMRVRRDNLIKILDRGSFDTVAIEMTAGGAAQSGTRLEINLPYVEQDFSDIEVPESEEVTASIPFVAMASAGNDSIEIIGT